MKNMPAYERGGAFGMKVKQIQFTAQGVAQLVDIDMNEPQAGQVRVKLAVSSISIGTERANLVGNSNISVADAGSVRFLHEF